MTNHYLNTEHVSKADPGFEIDIVLHLLFSLSGCSSYLEISFVLTKAALTWNGQLSYYKRHMFLTHANGFVVLKMATPNRSESVQKQIQQDWVNREYIEIITISIKKITDFLNSFDLSCRSKLAGLNEKLTTLERKIDYLEACVTKGETLT
ncbi:unnamed protein product [Acanthoscelides obtectus]|uniref:Uncharacterized protein n=1 Tax=Acanthoscelides obtectus TaxID=200917 RepID=A0A9P0MM72_ACAOB|nr:unnamed protein product [Acanthoscelides obtectus]CAK1643087.1 Probable protein BRICK1-B [Acanthoscelides obtectus]